SRGFLRNDRDEPSREGTLMRVRVLLLGALATAVIPIPVALHHLPGAPWAGSGTGSSPVAAPWPMRDARRATDGSPVASEAAALPRPLLHAGPVSASSPGFWSWALLDRYTGELTGSPNLNAVNDTASMIKAWLAADYLRRAAE